MKEQILMVVDQMIIEGEKLTYREIGKKLDTVASTITYQFGSKDNLIKEYFDYKFTQAYKSNNVESFSELMEFSLYTNSKIFKSLDYDINLHALNQIHNTLLSKHHNSFKQLYIKQYNGEDDIDMSMKLSFIHLISTSPEYFKNVHQVEVTDKTSIHNFVKNIT